ncbi:BlaI/MecI/CopY family transcriptional regulator [Egibacter rhizosphaerae]|uniref:BlaI/MecI/CopY family transcriptional regulator n=1 Tax=Egibacter rhizosphaerae TaxID=1670831 RepID=A0A411YKL6_9ACTN|nr:BlaI/MecI/CopY family transcriptional regulator [Egibacter rhizosphaerae]QBI21758.1 BlaI/MecI/CopY family transcriptional regulator [Egibacter rhizosphaerae]
MVRRRDELQGLLGPLETEVMETVWDQGDTTVREVHAALGETRDLAYTTVMTTMARLASKGLLERDTSGLAHRYRPAISRDEYARTTVTSVVDWLVERFPEPALSYFVEKMDADGEADTADLRSRVERLRQQEG